MGPQDAGEVECNGADEKEEKSERKGVGTLRKIPVDKKSRDRKMLLGGGYVQNKTVTVTVYGWVGHQCLSNLRV